VDLKDKVALIVGVGSGLSASTARGSWTWEIEVRPWVEEF
jgi:hypothetical protein